MSKVNPDRRSVMLLAFHEMINSYQRHKDMRELYEVGIVDEVLIDDYEEYEKTQELNFIDKLFKT